MSAAGEEDKTLMDQLKEEAGILQRLQELCSLQIHKLQVGEGKG